MSRLVQISSQPLVAEIPAANVGSVVPGFLTTEMGAELMGLLWKKNGFYAFESALLVRPFSSNKPPLGILQWNEPLLWKREYKSDLSGAVFFGEDVFGIQLCLRENAIARFNPETAEFKTIASDLEGWARWLLEEHKNRTGWPLAHFWQLRHGPLKPGIRLPPKVPFVLGGNFTLDNLDEFNEVDGLRYEATLANHLLEYPDGTTVKLRVERTGK